MSVKLSGLLSAFALALSACATTPQNPAAPDGQAPIAKAPAEPQTAPDFKDSETAARYIPNAEFWMDYSTGRPAEFAALPGWGAHNPAPAFEAFLARCEIWQGWADHENPLFAQRLPQFGHTIDWLTVCEAAHKADDPRGFFETWFRPFTFEGGDAEGLLTGYYEPEIEVRKTPSLEFSESILARPPDLVVQDGEVYRKTPDGLKRYPERENIGPALAPVLAFGRPMDVFFMQIQGSGRLRFEDGTILRAAYNGHNGHEYTSIGGVLIRRGELTRDNASKSAIENWMRDNGREAARALINENDRYIFFKGDPVNGPEGPKGAARVPLVPMASMAVDDDLLPYGVPVWLETTLPQKPGDFKGAPQQLLVIALDTGGAIKGPQRGDLYFGSGDEAGKRAGVMKHPAKWTLLLPVTVIARLENEAGE